MGKFYNIDPETCKKEELEAAIDNCKLNEEYYHTMEQSCKRFINSQYGALANKYYNCANIAIAESITLQGQDLIKYSVIKVNDYFTNQWPTDVEAHRKIADMLKKIYPDFDDASFMSNATNKLMFGSTLQVYGDTDSAYITLQPLIDSCRIPLNMETDFVLAVNTFVLAGYLEEMFDQYARDFNCKKNLEKFELEKVARAVIMLAKKKYIMDISWKEPDVKVDPLHSIVYKGIEVIQGSTPKFCRDCMKNFIKFLLSYIDAGQTPSFELVLEKIKEIKAMFRQQNPNEICKSFGMKDYEKFIEDDKDQIVYRKVTDSSTGSIKDITVPIHVRAAALYNNKLQTGAMQYRSKYNKIKSGDKVKFYYTTEKDSDGQPIPFGFMPNEFPIEFAPAMDFDEQFSKMILDPLNRIIHAAGYNEISPTLTYTEALWEW